MSDEIKTETETVQPVKRGRGRPLTGETKKEQKKFYVDDKTKEFISYRASLYGMTESEFLCAIIRELNNSAKGKEFMTTIDQNWQHGDLEKRSKLKTAHFNRMGHALELNAQRTKKTK